MTALETDHQMVTPRSPHAGRAVGTARAEVVVAIVDPMGHADRVEAFLPRRWATRRYRSIYEIDRPDLLVVGRASPPLVAAARLLHPEATLFALIDDAAPPRNLVDILHSGADVCVRDGALHILAAHLIAGPRRRLRRRSHARRFAG
jgi:hypothetical protein